jgi:nitroreductase
MIAMRDYLATRRSTSVRFLGDPGPDDATLADILARAARVPDHGKLAPWRFIVFAGEARAQAGESIAALAEPGKDAGLVEEDRQRFTRAPVVVAVVSRAAPHPKIPEWEQVLSAGAVCLNMIHAAAAYGFAATWITEWIAYDERAKAVLGIGPEENVAGFIHIGTPEVPPTERDRPDLAAITSRFGAVTTA